MLFEDGFYLDIERIIIAHECTLNKIVGCEYPLGRGHYGLVYVLSGKAEYRFFNEERFWVEAGDVLFLSPGCAYSIFTDDGFRHYTVNFDIHEQSSRLGATEQPYCLLRENNTLWSMQIFKDLVDVWTLKRSGYEMRTLGYLYELLSRFCSDYNGESKRETYRRLLLAKEHIEQHYDEPITLERLAFLSDMSVTNFRREWKSITRSHLFNTVTAYVCFTLRNISAPDIIP
jgi:hypothetical protein